MKFELQRRLAEDTDSYERDIVEKYVEYLVEAKDVVEVGNLLFDAEAMLQTFVCDTQLCFPEKKRGRSGGACSSCCVSYTPRLSKDERDRIEEILENLTERFPWLEKRMDKLGGYYEWDAAYDRMVTKDSAGRCVFLTPNTKDLGFYACTIHSYCLEKGLDPHLYKPSACVMFPLFILDVDSDEGTILVTSQHREVLNLGEEEDNYHEVGCMVPNKLAKEPMYREMKSTLVTMFGEKAWNILDESLRDRI
ncbi:DUF3109 family protein [bacterium]|nr:DUF3109 family protein [bacterium]